VIDPTKCFWSEQPLPCGCDHCLEEAAEIEAKKPKPFPAEYLQAHEWGWSKERATEFFEFFDKWLYCDRETTYIDKATGERKGTGKVLNRKGVAFAYDPDHTQVRGTADELEQTVDEDHCDGPVIASKDAPPIVRELANKLTAYLRAMPGYENRAINYISVIKYPDEKAQIWWHAHGEDNGVDTPVLIVSTGEPRPFHLCLQEGNKQVRARKATKVIGPHWSRIAEHGSLIVMPASFNDTHLHAILPESEPCGPRISVNTKCLIPPRVFSIKGRRYPRFAVYVGCRYPGVNEADKPFKEGTVYGNDYEPFKGHYKPIARNETDFRMYAEKKWLDPDFRAQAIKDLRGKHLLCWCIQDGPNRAPFCHARVWLDIVNRPEGK